METLKAMYIKVKKEYYRKRFQMELVCLLVNKKAETVRKAMQRAGLERSTAGYAAYLRAWIDRH